MPQPESGSTSVDRAQPYKSDIGSIKDSATNTATNNNQLTNFNQGGSVGSGSGSDLSLTSWSGLNLDQLQLQWSGTEPSSKEYTVAASLPQGLAPQGISMSVDERTRMLTLQCQTKNHQEQKDENGTFYASQDSASFAQRSFTLPDDVDLSGIKATKNNQGGFSLHLPKNTNSSQQPSQGVKQITIQ